MRDAAKSAPIKIHPEKTFLLHHGETTQWVKCLSSKYEDLSFIPRSHSMVIHNNNPELGKQAQVDPNIHV